MRPQSIQAVPGGTPTEEIMPKTPGYSSSLRPAAGLVPLLLACVALAETAPVQSAVQSPARETFLDKRPAPPGGEAGRGVYKARINPHWFQNNSRFWYRNDLRDGAKEFIVVDAEHGMRQPAFDHQKLAAALSRAAATQFNADRLPFSEIEFIEQAKAIRFDAADKTWRCDLNSYECAAIVERADSIPAKSHPLPGQRARVSGKGAYDSPNADEPGDARDQTPSPADDGTPPAQQQGSQRQTQSEGQDQTRADKPTRGEQGESQRSPDGKWSAFIK